MLLVLATAMTLAGVCTAAPAPAKRNAKRAPARIERRAPDHGRKDQRDWNNLWGLLPAPPDHRAPQPPPPPPRHGRR